MSPSSLDEVIRPGRFAGVEDSGGIVERFISEPKPDSALGRVLAKKMVSLSQIIKQRFGKYDFS